jgi:hypothetical protein
MNKKFEEIITYMILGSLAALFLSGVAWVIHWMWSG